MRSPGSTTERAHDAPPPARRPLTARVRRRTPIPQFSIESHHTRPDPPHHPHVHARDRRVRPATLILLGLGSSRRAHPDRRIRPGTPRARNSPHPNRVHHSIDSFHVFPRRRVVRRIVRSSTHLARVFARFKETERALRRRVLFPRPRPSETFSNRGLMVGNPTPPDLPTVK